MSLEPLELQQEASRKRLLFAKVVRYYEGCHDDAGFTNRVRDYAQCLGELYHADWESHSQVIYSRMGLDGEVLENQIDIDIMFQLYSQYASFIQKEIDLCLALQAFQR